MMFLFLLAAWTTTLCQAGSIGSCSMEGDTYGSLTMRLSSAEAVLGGMMPMHPAHIDTKYHSEHRPTTEEEFKQVYANSLIGRMLEVGMTTQSYDVSDWPEDLKLPPFRGNACLLKTDVVNSTNLWATNDRMLEYMTACKKYLREQADEYGVYIADEIGDSMIFSCEDPKVMLNFAIEIFWGFRRTSDDVVKIRVGVWYGDVSDVGINFTGFIQYYGRTYKNVKKIEESTDESIALYPAFYELVKDALPFEIPQTLGRDGQDAQPYIHQIDFESNLQPQPAYGGRILNPPMDANNKVEAFDRVYDEEQFATNVRKALRGLAEQIGMKVEDQHTVADSVVAQNVPFGRGGIMFAKVITNGEEHWNVRGDAYGEMVSDVIDVIRRDGNCYLMEEVNDDFIVTCIESNNKALLLLADKMHKAVLNHPIFSLKIALHTGPYETGVNRYGMAHHWGRPMNEDCRQFTSDFVQRKFGKVSMTQEFIQSLGSDYNLVKSDVSPVIRAKGAEGKEDFNGNSLRPNEMARLITYQEGNF